MKYRSLVTLAAVLLFNAGAFAGPEDNDQDVSLINQPAKESFGARMAKARAAKKNKKPAAVKAPRTKKVRAAKTPHIPKVPAIPGF